MVVFGEGDSVRARWYIVRVKWYYSEGEGEAVLAVRMIWYMVRVSQYLVRVRW